ncbi:hypothetical protein M378DRAFT_171328 [Amanita muscaria Koide BX008]|uniref:Uncharacterized protein n=1 Tax=Amanita muscaria (strain Koide BX008) TaxID=946122 RepID=A0A0C2SUQ2_AMAMK|nr:hypothetical protein M378DRAFT_171328 [Amanita muscaria Koide BX008]
MTPVVRSPTDWLLLHDYWDPFLKMQRKRLIPLHSTTKVSRCLRNQCAVRGALRRNIMEMIERDFKNCKDLVMTQVCIRSSLLEGLARGIGYPILKPFSDKRYKRGWKRSTNPSELVSDSPL